MKNLQPGEFPDYYIPYINAVKSLDIVDGLEDNMNDFIDFIENTVHENKYEYRYQPEKWTIKDIVLHIIDAERIFAYRALRMARFDRTPLAGFEENDYVPVAEANKRSMTDLLHEFAMVRKSTICLFQSMSEEMLLNKGIASGKEISVRSIGYIITGHCIHHQNVIKERYL
ncbi:DinB family protein [Flavobacterium amniphilum]|uniref:DinB family protein n=1 Tax=Flavobacterium amniphilum TaxID=1834035 RepID=UPI00202A64F1|nr:DinB family protein [Flavobacterium amniphilum]MCL9804269.1 DinB family protein [Flavobacterium amniphilum]